MDLADLERAIAETARAQTSVIAAYLFGSHAAGRAHRESDVDLAVLLEHDALPTTSARLRPIQCRPRPSATTDARLA